MITTINEFKKTLVPQKKYLGQCDALRRNNPENEKLWQDMMKNKVRIPFARFVKEADCEKILDDGETIQELILNARQADKKTAFYASNWGDRDAVFIQTAGFEFIFA